MPRTRASSPLVAPPLQADLETLAEAARSCHGCPLYKAATQTVFGSGPSRARLVLVGEQPGQEEDLEGTPFVGPAGRLLRGLLDEAPIDPQKVYLTNAVKHFKYEVRGKRRIHQRPNRSEVKACRPWLTAELDTIRPAVLILLGVTASQSLLGSDFRVTQHQGELLSTPWCSQTLATLHPSAVLRAPSREARDEMRTTLLASLRQGLQLLGG